MGYLKEKFLFFDTNKLYGDYYKQGLINPDSICFLKETGKIVHYGELFGGDKDALTKGMFDETKTSPLLPYINTNNINLCYPESPEIKGHIDVTYNNMIEITSGATHNVGASTAGEGITLRLLNGEGTGYSGQTAALKIRPNQLQFTTINEDTPIIKLSDKEGLSTNTGYEKSHITVPGNLELGSTYGHIKLNSYGNTDINSSGSINLNSEEIITIKGRDKIELRLIGFNQSLLSITNEGDPKLETSGFLNKITLGAKDSFHVKLAGDTDSYHIKADANSVGLKASPNTQLLVDEKNKRVNFVGGDFRFVFKEKDINGDYKEGGTDKVILLSELAELTNTNNSVLGNLSGQLISIRNTVETKANASDVNSQINSVASQFSGLFSQVNSKVSALEQDFSDLLNTENLNDSFDTLKEVDTWIKAHESEAASIIEDINSLRNNLDVVETLAETINQGLGELEQSLVFMTAEEGKSLFNEIFN